MPRKGRFLELLVKQLQESLVSEGIEVRSPEEFYKGGQKIGEIDVTLRGKFGTSTVFVGIECRDRPQDGPQGREWIREIIGEKEDFCIHKMIAVSSTGFTQPAIELAEKTDVQLLVLDEATQNDLQDWFDTLTLCWNDPVTNEFITVKMVINVCRELSDNEVIALTGTCALQTSQQKLRVHGIAKKKKSSSMLTDLTVHFMTESGEEYCLPEGTEIILGLIEPEDE